jgi:hypothetical protein
MIPIPARKLPPDRVAAPGPGHRPRAPSRGHRPPRAPAQVTALAARPRSPRPALPAPASRAHTMNAGTRVPMPNIASKFPQAPPPRRNFRPIPKARRPASSARSRDSPAPGFQPPGSIPGAPIPPSGHPANQMKVTLYRKERVESAVHWLMTAPPTRRMLLMVRVRRQRSRPGPHSKAPRGHLGPTRLSRPARPAPSRPGPTRPQPPRAAAVRPPRPPRVAPRRARLRARDHAAAPLAATLELPILRRFAWSCALSSAWP